MRTDRKSSERSIALDVLRVVSMLLIVAIHFFGHGGVIENVAPFSAQYFLSNTALAFCYTAVNSYVLISGYFLCESEFKAKKLINLVVQVLFWSVLIYAVLLSTGQISFGFKDAVTAFLPTLTGRYWFVTAYVAMYLISPFLGAGLAALDKKQHQKLLFVLFALFCIIPGVFSYFNYFEFGGGNGPVWFVVLYCAAAYLKKYYTPDGKPAKWFLLWLLFVSALPAMRFLCAGVAHTPLASYVSAGTLEALGGVFHHYNSVPVAGASIFIFIAFLNVRIKSSALAKAAAVLSPLTFGVYLIHDNAFLRPFIWRVVNAPAMLGKWYFPLFAVAVVVGIFTVCAALERLRQLLFMLVSKIRR